MDIKRENNPDMPLRADPAGSEITTEGHGDHWTGVSPGETALALSKTPPPVSDHQNCVHSSARQRIKRGFDLGKAMAVVEAARIEAWAVLQTARTRRPEPPGYRVWAAGNFWRICFTHARLMRRSESN